MSAKQPMFYLDGTVRTERRGALPKKMTPRRLECLRLLCSGKSGKETANAMGLSDRTTKAHIARLFKDTGVTSHAQLGVWAVRSGYLETSRVHSTDAGVGP